MPDPFSFQQLEHIAYDISVMSVVIGMARNTPPDKCQARSEPTGSDSIPTAAAEPGEDGPQQSGRDGSRRISGTIRESPARSADQ